LSELYSQRHGYKSSSTVAQTHSMDMDLKTGIWNCLVLHGLGRLSEDDRRKPYRDENSTFLVDLYQNLLKKPIDEIPEYHPHAFDMIKEHCFNCQWYEVYDIVDFALAHYPKGGMASSIECLNRILERENAGHRVVNGKIAPITSSGEIKEIERASQSKVGPVRQQLEKAMALLSDRRLPNPADSVKNSISAVESLCKIIAADGSKTLSESLRGVEKRVGLPKALSKSLDCLYGYRSIAPGVGHGGTVNEDVSQDEARFFLVTCSAWVNYLTAKSAVARVKID